MALTYVAIASTTVPSGGQSNIEFTSIPNTYTDLVIRWSLRSTEANNFTDQGFRVTFNNTTTGYDNQLLFGNLTTPGAATNSNVSALQWVYGNAANSTSSIFAIGEMYIPNYASGRVKSIGSDSFSENNNSGDTVRAFTAGFWNNTSAITSIKLATATGSWVEHSSATLYGIKNTV
jgi:hypothetical protein